jgi:hypothetical protein
MAPPLSEIRFSDGSLAVLSVIKETEGVVEGVRTLPDGRRFKFTARLTDWQKLCQSVEPRQGS